MDVNAEMLSALKRLYAAFYRSHCELESCGCEAAQFAAEIQALIQKAEQSPVQQAEGAMPATPDPDPDRAARHRALRDY